MPSLSNLKSEREIQRLSDEIATSLRDNPPDPTEIYQRWFSGYKPGMGYFNFRYPEAFVKIFDEDRIVEGECEDVTGKRLK